MDIYKELIDTLKTEMRSGFGAVVDRLDRHEVQFERMNQRLDDHSIQLVGINQRLDDHSIQLVGINQKLDDHSLKLAGLGKDIRDLKRTMNSHMTGIGQFLIAIDKDLADHERRISNIEKKRPDKK